MNGNGIERILLAVDGGEASGIAVAQLIALAKSIRARVRLVHVWDPVACQETRPQAQWLLQEAGEAFRLEGVEIEECLRDASSGGIGHAISDAAGEWGADMVALGSCGTGDVEAMLRGSVSHEVLAQVKQPVLVLRGLPHPLVPMRLLIASGGGDQARLATAVAMVALPGSEAVVLHVGRIASAMELALVEPADRALELRRRGLRRSGRLGSGPPPRSVGVPSPTRSPRPLGHSNATS